MVLKRLGWTLALAGLAGLCLLLPGRLRVSASPATASWTVHEWGTFTELQDEAGRSLGGINVDDEPVPDFVHGFGQAVLVPPHSTWPVLFRKGIPGRHPQVTMRLETPVLYFYPPAQEALPARVDVAVSFRGGWLSEFYPQAEYVAPGLKQSQLQRDTVGSLAWHDLQVGTTDEGPETDDPVWTTPRQTDAAMVTASSGEAERYLFYRGVGNLSGPLRVNLDREHNLATLRPTPDALAESDAPLHFADAWLVQVQEDEELAYRRLGPLTAQGGSDQVLAQVSCQFEPTDFSSGNLDQLKTEMHQVLTESGLFPKEATAMLNTWNRAYFQSPGLRLFYLVPPRWTDQRLPLQISVPAQIERVMMGRVELVTEQQRKLIEQISQGPIAPAKWISEIPKSEARIRFLKGRSDFGSLGVPIPEDYQAYLQLGRFRNALLRAEYQRQPTPALKQFMDQYRLHGLPIPQATKEPAAELAAQPLQ